MKHVYFFGGGKADGEASMKNLLGGKGANLAEMTSLGVPVPPGFTITTAVCDLYYQHGEETPAEVMAQVWENMAKVEAVMEGPKYGDVNNPLLVSVRSGARKSMPGMMDTVLNVGLSTDTIPGLIKQFNDERFVYDAYRRLITMYADVVMEKAAGVEVDDHSAIRPQLEEMMEAVKEEKGYVNDTELTVEDLKALTAAYKAKIEAVLGKPFPDDARVQLQGAIDAVFASWNGRRAISYRNIEGIPHNWGTAVNVQSMVFGNAGEDCATGVAFTRDPGSGENIFYGEWLINAQGEDVVAGIRTPNALNEDSKQEGQNDTLPTLQETMPHLYEEFAAIRAKLEAHYHDMQDLEFTIQRGKLFMLQTRTGKRTGAAAVKMAVDMVQEGLIDTDTALMRVNPEQLDELLHPMLNPEAERAAKIVAKGLPAGPGGAVGRVVLNSARAWEQKDDGDPLILVRLETSPEDVDGMRAAAGILTARGGMTSHAALVARGWGKCCIVGCAALDINYSARTLTVGGKVYNEGDWISLNGTTGVMYEGKIDVMDADPDSNEAYATLMGWADERRRLGVHTNADNPEDAARARKFGAKGIGLCRTEHMFFGEDRIRAMRAMILADTPAKRAAALEILLPYQRDDFYGILKAMAGYPVTIRLLDPPLHEFLPAHDDAALIAEVAGDLNVSVEALKHTIEGLHEFNPMLGHRGCRLGISIPEISRMQAQAILEAAKQLKAEGVDAQPEIMVPLVGNVKELAHQKAIILEVAEQVGIERDAFKIGTMIEIPRAAVTADQIAVEAQFFSFGTNDLTQMGCGFSRDDSGSFLPHYVKGGIYERDPFQSLDWDGVGGLVAMAVEKGRAANPHLHLGICGEHGGDPHSIEFFNKVGLDYVSCSPFRVPIARLAAAQATIKAQA
ncbi:pyruvate, phosphate dikinase [Myxococcota bacterium]|nr:pyruvate, phosphate dikinase [Myxococcota bacterium]MBU1433131.1 pyruvate, phosphate dikinase [Myxococcota bacterium]MBU1900729.1 pyruvate, phosphate dikinase [Myxococcota bacterium]